MKIVIGLSFAIFLDIFFVLVFPDYQELQAKGYKLYHWGFGNFFFFILPTSILISSFAISIYREGFGEWYKKNSNNEKFISAVIAAVITLLICFGADLGEFNFFFARLFFCFIVFIPIWLIAWAVASIW